MGITRFFYTLLFLSAAFLFYTKQTAPVQVKVDEKPTVTFENSVMYEIDTTKVKQVIQSQKANIFKGYEELYNATIIAKTKDNVESSNTLSAKHIVKIKDDIYLNGDVHFQSYNDVVFTTNQIHYNTKTDIAKNESEFVAKRGDSVFKGVDLYYDSKSNRVTASDTQFKIDLKETK